jgi:hypothetical protein
MLGTTQAAVAALFLLQQGPLVGAIIRADITRRHPEHFNFDVLAGPVTASDVRTLAHTDTDWSFSARIEEVDDPVSGDTVSVQVTIRHLHTVSPSLPVPGAIFNLATGLSRNVHGVYLHPFPIWREAGHGDIERADIVLLVLSPVGEYSPGGASRDANLEGWLLRFEAVDIPEPSTVFLLLSGVGLLFIKKA